jgi:hypothetical protein
LSIAARLALPGDGPREDHGQAASVRCAVQ